MLITNVPGLLFGAMKTITPEEMIQEARRFEVSRLNNEDALAGIKQVRKDAITRAKETEKLLQALDKKAKVHAGRMEILLHSDQGKCIVRDPVAFMTYVQLERNPAVTPMELRLKVDLASSLAERAQLGREEQDVSYLPNETVRTEIYSLYFWVKDREIRLQAQIDSLNKISGQKVFTEDMSSAKTLAASLTEYNALWQKLLAESEITGKLLAQEQKQQILIDANKLIELEKAEKEAERIKAENEAELFRQQQGYETRLMRQKVDLEEERMRTEQALEIKIEQLENDLEEAREAQNLKNAEHGTGIQKTRYKTRRQELTAKIESPEVQMLLAPFINKDYWQPGNTKSGEKSGISFSYMQRQGLLNSSLEGQKKMLGLGTSKYNRRRGTWPFPRLIGRLTEEQRDQVLQAQEYLAELGPTMVELGYLAE